MVRILLFITLIAVGASGYLAYNDINGKIDNLTSERDSAQQSSIEFEEKMNDAVTAQSKAESEAETAVAELEQAKVTNIKLGQQLTVQRNRAETATANFNQATAELVESRQTSERWRQFEMEYGTRDSIKANLATIASVKNERDNFITENSILLSRIEQLSVELSRYTGTSVKVNLPSDLAGKVTAVDSQYDFVVLNVGEDQGVREHGELLVGRSDKLIGRLRVLSVEKNRSIANIMPDYKQSEIQTGDSVYSERN
jgi:vacuolar-type H+-ATPase subunit I/STV1